MSYANRFDQHLMEELVRDLFLGYRASRRIKGVITEVVGKRHAGSPWNKLSWEDQQTLSRIVDSETHLPNSSGLDTLLLSRIDQIEKRKISVPLHFVNLEIRGAAYSMRDIGDYLKYHLNANNGRIPGDVVGRINYNSLGIMMHNATNERVTNVITSFLTSLPNMKKGPMSGVAGISQYFPGKTLQELKSEAYESSRDLCGEVRHEVANKLPDDYVKQAKEKAVKIFEEVAA